MLLMNTGGEHTSIRGLEARSSPTIKSSTKIDSGGRAGTEVPIPVGVTSVGIAIVVPSIVSISVVVSRIRISVAIAVVVTRIAITIAIVISSPLWKGCG